MGRFAEPFWEIAIVVLTLGGIAFLVWLMVSNLGVEKRPDGDETTGHIWDNDLRELNNPLPRWWVNLFYVTIVFGVIYLAFYPGLGNNDMFLGWTQLKQYEEEIATAQAEYAPVFDAYLASDIKTLARDENARRVGRRLFLNHCAACHGSDGGGNTGFPSLLDSDWLYGGEPDVIKATILNGRSGVMPPWGSVLGGEKGVKAMTQLVLGLSGASHDSGEADTAKQQFATICAVCHAADGTGNKQMGAPNLTDSIWLYGGDHDAVAASIADGRIGQMPAHETVLGEAKAHVLAAYVYSLSRQ